MNRLHSDSHPSLINALILFISNLANIILANIPYFCNNLSHFFLSFSRYCTRSCLTSCFGGDAIKVKIKDDCRRPHLSTDRNHFRADTTRPLGKHLGQVSKTSDQWPRRRCDNEKKNTDGRLEGGCYTKKRNLAAESYPGCYGIAGFKACKTNFS